MVLHRAALADWKAGDKTEPEPKPPRKARYLVESATVEALQEVLRDDADGQALYAPLGKVLVRQDELSEFLAGMDKYSGQGQRPRRLPPSLQRREVLRSTDRPRLVRANSWSACLLGGIQPEPIQRIATEAVDDGLLPTHDARRAAATGDGEDRGADRSTRDTYRDHVPRTGGAQTGADERQGILIAVALHRDAHAAREDINALARVMAAMPDASPRLQSTFGKWPGLFARLCLTFHLIEVAAAGVRGEIGPPIAVVPAEIAARRPALHARDPRAEPTARREPSSSTPEQTDHAAWIAGYILAHRLERIAARDIVQSYRLLRAPEGPSTVQGFCLPPVAAGLRLTNHASAAVRPLTLWAMPVAAGRARIRSTWFALRSRWRPAAVGDRAAA